MFQVDVDEAERFAKSLTITHQETGDLQPFVFTSAQRRVLKAIEEHRRVIVLKGRQVYISTACALYALLFACANPGTKVAIVADITEKANGLLAKCSEWVGGAGIPLDDVDNTKRLRLWNGAEIHAITANTPQVGTSEVKAGRSFSYGLIILSEFAYYNRDAALLASITRSALKGARIVIESTATPAENVFRSIWEKGSGWHREFISIEDHDAYQIDPGYIDDAKWSALAAEYGFTSRAHAAYWHRMVTEDFNGDVYRGLREAPVKPEQAFSFAEGRWIFRHEEREPIAVAGLTRRFTEDIRGGWRIYGEADDSGVILGVDTASGSGNDASSIAVVGYAKGNLLATFAARDINVPDFIDLCAATVKKWAPVATCVEANFIGAGVLHALSVVTRANIYRHDSSDAEKPIRMNIVKLAIESGQVAGGPDLSYEIKHSVMLRPKRNGGGPVWDGPDDIINAVGFALAWRRDNPHRSTVPHRNHLKQVDRARVRKAKHQKLM